MSEEQTVITLKDDDAALVIGPNGLNVYIPNQDDEDDVPEYVLMLIGVAAMLQDEELTEQLLEGVTLALEPLGNV